MPSTNSLPENRPPQNPLIRIHKFIRTEKPRKQRYPWETNHEGEIKICDMDDLHLVRTVKLLERNAGAKYPFQQPYVNADRPLPGISRRTQTGGNRFRNWEKPRVLAYECMILEMWYRKIAVPPGSFVTLEDLQGARLGFEADGEDLAPVRPSCTELIKEHLKKEYVINLQSSTNMWGENLALTTERRNLISAVLRAGLNDTDFIGGCAKVNTWINTAYLEDEISTVEKRAYLDILTSLRYMMPEGIRRQIQLDDDRRHMIEQLSRQVGEQVGNGLYFQGTHEEILMHGSEPFNLLPPSEPVVHVQRARQGGRTRRARQALIDHIISYIHDELREDMERVFGNGYRFLVEAHTEHPDPMAIVIKVRHISERSWSHEFHTLQELKSFMAEHLNPTTPPPPEPTMLNAVYFEDVGGQGYSCEVLAFETSWSDPHTYILNVRFPLPESISEGLEAIIQTNDNRTFRCKVVNISELTQRCQFTVTNLINL